jgi:hypothetical protein
VQEPEVKRPEHEDNPDVYCEPLPELVPEEQDVHGDHDGDHRQHIEHDGWRSSHGHTMHPTASSGDRAQLGTSAPDLRQIWEARTH